MPLDALTREIFDAIYSTDLVFAKDCYQLCGDAHCCNFTRYKSRFEYLGQGSVVEIPLLPGEFQFLEERGWLGQFQPYEHNVLEFELAEGKLIVDTILSRRPGCGCDHPTRTTACRLYPLLPVFAVDGSLKGVDLNLSIFEEMESIERLERACKLTSLPFSEVEKYLSICGQLRRSPLLVFYMSAYRAAKLSVRSRLAARLDPSTRRYRSAFNVFEQLLLNDELFDLDAVRGELSTLAADFRGHHGSRFQLPGAPLGQAPAP
jgi:hypothetical protein